MGCILRLHELAGLGDCDGLGQLLSQLPPEEAGQQQGVGARDAQGCTALHFAADRGQLQTARQLLAAGVDPDCVDEDGQTALHYAALCGHEKVAQLLLEAGANERAVDHAGQKAEDIAPPGWTCWRGGAGG
ncbi:achain crystal structure of engineered northeast structural genomics consortium target, partial [Haematococcus lacustris]